MAQYTMPNNECATTYLDPITKCSRPLSCQECLAIKGCSVDSSGYCGNISQAIGGPGYYNQQYTRAVALNLSLPAAKDDTRLKERQYWLFEGQNATYCPESDPICQNCIRNNFWTPFQPDALDSRFCIGTNSCVCISSCYHGESWCETLYYRDHPRGVASTPSPIISSMPGASTPSTTSGPSPSFGSLPTDEECRYSTNTPSCQVFRTCRDCLQKGGCRISGNGFCERDAGNSTAFDYHNAFDKNLVVLGSPHMSNDTSTLNAAQYWQFPSSSASYCPTTDTLCQRCSQNRFWLANSIKADSRFCVGAGGCICVANCAQFESMTTCPSQAAVEDSNDSHMFSWLFGVGAVAFVLVLVLAIIRKRRRERMEDMIQQPTSIDYAVVVTPVVPGPPTPAGTTLPPSAPMLDPQPVQPRASQPSSSMRPGNAIQPTHPPTGRLELYGWISHRQHLIDAETRRLNGADDFVPARNHLHQYQR